MKNFLRSKFFDFICFVCSPSFIVYNLLYIFLDKGEYTDKWAGEGLNVSGLMEVSVGVAFVCLGFLVKHWKNTASK